MFQTFYDVLTNVAADAVKKTIKFILLLAKNQEKKLLEYKEA